MNARFLSRLPLLISLAVFAGPLPAQRNPISQVLLAPPELAIVTAVRAADEERVGATLAADAARLAAIYSDQLHYAHSNGVIDTKASFIESLVSGRSDYQAVDYVQRDFIPVGPGVVLMKGRAIVRLGTPGGAMLVDLNYLAVWREEGGRWRFLAWQSCRNPAPATP
jgi:hypothetical protein